MKAEPWGLRTLLRARNQTCTISSPSSHLLHRPICLNRPPLNYSSLHHFSEPRLRRGAPPSCQRHLAGLIPRVFLCSFPTPRPVHLHPHPKTHTHSSLCDSSSCVYPFQITPGRRLRHVTGALVITGKLAATPRLASIGAQKYHGKKMVKMQNVKEQRVSVGLCRDEQRHQNLTTPLLVILLPGAEGQPLDLLYSPTGRRHFGLMSPRSPPPSLLLGFFFFFCPVWRLVHSELYLISFCWVN